MILYNIVLGNLNLAPDPWKHTIDAHGNHFITKEDLRQNIRIDGSIEESIYPKAGDLDPVWVAANMQCYHILPGTKWINNNRNMNPMLLATKEPKEEREQIVVYITVSNNYSIVRFNTNHRILQTYHKKDIFQGCAVVLNNAERTADNRIMNISVYDKKKNQYSQFNISFMKDDLNKIRIDRKAVTNTKILETMKKQVEKFSNRYMGFKIITKPAELLTRYYVTTEKYKNDIIKATANINNVRVITIDNPAQATDISSFVNDFVSKYQKEFEIERIRSITQCGVNIPLDAIKQLKLLYVFNYNIKDNVLSCRKSN